MKKLLLSISLIFAAFSANAQVLLSNSFDDITTLGPTGWTLLNRSTAVGTTTWFQGNATVFPSYSGATTSYIGANFNATTGTNTISNWLITPSQTLQNGDVISFYTRTGTGSTFPDRLELRLSTAGAFSADPATTTTVGDYTTLALSVNPALNPSEYPETWTQFSYTVTGLIGQVDCRIAFRYFVTSGGPTGANSNFIGIDDFAVTRPLANTQEFFAGNFAIQPNPVNDVFTLNAKNGVAIEKVEVLDINGRIVNQVNGSSTDAIQVNVSELNSGVYFVRVQSDLGVGTSKIIKK
jgi:hypothetical protein